MYLYDSATLLTIFTLTNEPVSADAFGKMMWVKSVADCRGKMVTDSGCPSP